MIKISKNNILAQNHFNDVKNIIVSQIERFTLKDNPRLKKNNNWIYLSNQNKSKLEILLNNNVLKEVITCEPEGLIEIIERYSDYNTNIELSKFIYNIFVEHGYINGVKNYEFIKNIGQKTCPYCNRSYIYTLTNNNEVKPEIDHFYPKHKYPLLAVSYYNLIPSCPTCNGFGAKGKKDPIEESLINPYLIESNDYKFNVEINNINILNPISDIIDSSVSIKFSDDNLIQGNVSVFKLDELYKEHRDIVLELYVKSQLEYSQTYIDYLKSYTELQFSDEEIKRLITCNYMNDTDLHKRPLSKLMKDVAEQFELTKTL